MYKQKIESITSTLYVYDDYIIKKINKFLEFPLFENEVKWLNILRDYDRFPTIIEVNEKEKEIKMSNVGQRITKNNLPNDWEDQINIILSNLEKNSCCHNDIKPEEILVKNGIIYLIDFGWATKKGDEIPKNFPNIGYIFKYGYHNFDDRYSFKKSVEYVLGG